VVRGLFWLLWLLPFTCSAADSRLWIELESQTTEMGRALHATLYATAIEREPRPDDLLPLTSEFALREAGEAEPVAAAGRAQEKSYRLGFTLYPRRSGILTIPALTIAGIRSAPLSVTVQEALSQGVPLSITPQLSSTSVWMREQVLLTLEVITPDLFANLQIEPPALPGFEVVPIPATRERVEGAEGKRVRLRTGIALFALTSGSHRLRLPLVHYRLDGGTRRLFPLPEPLLEVKALPPYLPPTLPVGRVRIDSSLEPGGLLHTGELAFWHIALQAKALPPQWLPQLQRQLLSGDEIRFLPSESSYSMSPDASGVNARVEHRIPLVPLADGRLPLPELTLQYFDPASGRLERSVHRPPRPLTLGDAARLTAAAVSMALLLWLAPRLWRRWRSWWQRQRDRRAALDELGRAENSAALRAALRRYAAADGGSINMPWSEWQQRYKERVPAEELASLLNASYSERKDIDLQRLRDRLLQGLRARR
jgi:hypothetical protein